MYLATASKPITQVYTTRPIGLEVEQFDKTVIHNYSYEMALSHFGIQYIYVSQSAVKLASLPDDGAFAAKEEEPENKEEIELNDSFQEYVKFFKLKESCVDKNGWLFVINTLLHCVYLSTVHVLALTLQIWMTLKH